LRVFTAQAKSLFTDVDIEGNRTTVAVVPHPSGRSTFWNQPIPEKREILEAIQRHLLKALA
jgi:hypothetical protein